MTNQLTFQHLLIAAIELFAIVVALLAIKCLAESMIQYYRLNERHRKLLENLRYSSLTSEEIAEVLCEQPPAPKAFSRAATWLLHFLTLKLPSHA